jgi:hypothetical protein
MERAVDGRRRGSPRTRTGNRARFQRIVAVVTLAAVFGGGVAALPIVHAADQAGTIVLPPSPTPLPPETPTPAPSPTPTPTPSPTPAPTPTDGAPPETTIDSAAGKTRDRSVTVTFSSSEAGATFECAIDGQISRCVSPFVLEGLGPGSHTFSVTAIDPAGNRDPSPAEGELRRRPGRRWTWRCFGSGGPCVVIRRRAA